MTEVVSGDCIVVKDAASKVERRVNLSSIRAPRIGRREDKPEDWALEAKEFLRNRLIGAVTRSTAGSAVMFCLFVFWHKVRLNKYRFIEAEDGIKARAELASMLQGKLTVDACAWNLNNFADQIAADAGGTLGRCMSRHHKAQT